MMGGQLEAYGEERTTVDGRGEHKRAVPRHRVFSDGHEQWDDRPDPLSLFLTVIVATSPIVGRIEGAAETTVSLVKVLSFWSSDKLNKEQGSYLLDMDSATNPCGSAIVGLHWDRLGPWAAFAFRIATSLSAMSLLLLSLVLRPASCR